MGYGLAADAVLLVHFAFVAFAVLGSLLVLRWPGLAWLHLPVTGWSMFVEFSGRICPLTPLENDLRRAAGEAGYEGDFIGHYLLAVLYPDGLTREIQFGLGAGLLAFNLIVYGLVLWHWRRRRSAQRS